MMRIVCLRHDARICVSIILCACFVGVASTAQPPAILKPSEPTEEGIKKNNPKPIPATATGGTKEAESSLESGRWDGFRGIKWGTDIKTLSGFIPFGTPEREGYIRNGEVLQFGAVTLKGLIWYFIGGKCSGLVMMSESGAFADMKKAIEDQYGHDSQDVPGQDREAWMWKGTGQNGEGTRIILYGKKGDEPVGCVIYSLPLWTKMDIKEASKTITYTQYERLKDGMNFVEVDAIMGRPGVEVSRNSIPAIRGVMKGIVTAAYVWRDDNGASLNVIFQNGRLVSKAQFGLK